MNKLEERKLRRIISETASQAFSQAKRNRSLKYIFEDAGEDIESAYKSGPGAVRSMVDNAKDKKGLKDALQGMFDGDPNDDKIAVGSPTQVNVGDLKATQSEIDLMKSIAFPLGSRKALEQMITSNTTGAPGSITVSGDLVLDGHHRWSGVLGICGPSGTVSAQDLDLPGSDKEKLAASQLAIAAYKPADTKMPTASDEIPYNILGAGADKIKQMILDNVGKQTDKKAPGPLLNDDMVKECSESDVVSKWAGFEKGADPEKVKDAIAAKVAGNLAQLKKGDAPPRADMPQFDHDDIGGKAAKDAIYKAMQDGEYNIEPPFKPAGKEAQTAGHKRDGQVVVERWQRIAGIIK